MRSTATVAADNGLTPDGIGMITGLAIAVLTFILLVWKKIWAGAKSIFTPLVGVATMLITLKTAIEKAEKTLAEHELRIRKLDWITTDNELLHSEVDDHESRLRVHDTERQQDRLDMATHRQEVEKLGVQLNTQGLQLNQLVAHNAIISSQLQTSNQHDAMASDQIQEIKEDMDRLMDHLLPPSIQRKRRKTD